MAHTPNPPQNPARLLALKPSGRLFPAALLQALLLLFWAAPAAQAQESIFNRFSTQTGQGGLAMVGFYLPVNTVPQTEPSATLIQNEGLIYEIGARPTERIYPATALEVSRLAWRPANPAIEKIQLAQFALIPTLNYRMSKSFYFQFGVGLGLMSGLVRYTDERNFATRLEPYLPIQYGLTWQLAGGWHLGARVSHSFFYGPGPVLGHTRLLGGLSYAY